MSILSLFTPGYRPDNRGITVRGFKARIMNAMFGLVLTVPTQPLYPCKRNPVPTVLVKLGRPKGRSGRVRKISPPPAFDPRTLQPTASRWAIPAHTTTTTTIIIIIIIIIIHFKYHLLTRQFMASYKSSTNASNRNYTNIHTHTHTKHKAQKTIQFKPI